MKRVIYSLCLLLTTVAMERALYAQNAFATTHHAAQALNPPGLTCTLRLSGGKTRFQQGEIIPIVLTFSSDHPGAYRLNMFQHPSFSPFCQFHAAPAAGAVNLQGPLTFSPIFNYNGITPPPPAFITAKPIVVPLTLNKWLRFDQPGHYRMYAFTQRVVDTQQNPKPAPFPTSAGPIVTSNSIEFDIVPTDKQWSHAEVKTQIAKWQTGKPNFIGGEWPESPLLYLGTSEAADAILTRLSRSTLEPTSNDDGWYWRPALLNFRDRPGLLDTIARAANRPDYSITPTVLDIWAEVSILQQQGAPSLRNPSLETQNISETRRWAEVRTQEKTRVRAQLWWQIYTTLEQKQGEAKAATLYTLLHTAKGPYIDKDEAIQSQANQLAMQLPANFDALPPSAQEFLLSAHVWPTIESPAMARPLRRLWDRLYKDNPNAKQGFDKAVSAELLRVRLNEAEVLASH